MFRVSLRALHVERTERTKNFLFKTTNQIMATPPEKKSSKVLERLKKFRLVLSSSKDYKEAVKPIAEAYYRVRLSVIVRNTLFYEQALTFIKDHPQAVHLCNEDSLCFESNTLTEDDALLQFIGLSENESVGYIQETQTFVPAAECTLESYFLIPDSTGERPTKEPETVIK